jgi:hypothetical protein
MRHPSWSRNNSDHLPIGAWKGLFQQHPEMMNFMLINGDNGTIANELHEFSLRIAMAEEPLEKKAVNVRPQNGLSPGGAEMDQT